MAEANDEQIINEQIRDYLKEHPSDALKLRENVQELIRVLSTDGIDGVTFPKLTVTTDENGETHLVSPYDRETIELDDLSSMDTADRWINANDIDPDNKKIIFFYDEIGEYHGLCYLIDFYINKPILLPEGWEEDQS